jgi:hypothetical protein
MPTFVENQTFIGSSKQAGSDNHAHTPERGARFINYVNCVFDANGAAEALKLSRHWDINVYGGRIIGGVEDGLDIVRGGRLLFQGVEFVQVPGQGQDVTCKGSARQVSFVDCRGLKKIVLGQYTKYDLRALYPDSSWRHAGLFRFARPPTRNVSIEGCEAPLVSTWHADKPTGDFRYNRWPSLLARPFFFFRSRFKELRPPADEEFSLTTEEV